MNKNKNKKLTCWDYEKKAANVLKSQVLPLLDKAILAAKTESVEDDAAIMRAFAAHAERILDDLGTGKYTLTNYFEDECYYPLWHKWAENEKFTELRTEEVSAESPQTYIFISRNPGVNPVVIEALFPEDANTKYVFSTMGSGYAYGLVEGDKPGEWYGYAYPNSPACVYDKDLLIKKSHKYLIKAV